MRQAITFVFMLVLVSCAGLVDPPKTLQEQLVLAESAVTSTANSVTRLKTQGIIQRGSKAQTYVDSTLVNASAALDSAWAAYDSGNQQAASAYLSTALAINATLIKLLQDMEKK